VSAHTASPGRVAANGGSPWSVLRMAALRLAGRLGADEVGVRQGGHLVARPGRRAARGELLALDKSPAGLSALR
jgi:hypothetical protein